MGTQCMVRATQMHQVGVSRGVSRLCEGVSAVHNVSVVC